MSTEGDKTYQARTHADKAQRLVTEFKEGDPDSTHKAVRELALAVNALADKIDELEAGLRAIGMHPALI